MLIGWIVAATVGVLATGCGSDEKSDSAATEARIERERAEAAEQARLEEKVKRLEQDLKDSQTGQRESTNQGRSESTKSSKSTSASAETWPSDTSAWTVVLVSADGRSEAETVAARARRVGLDEVGVLYSSDHSSLRPGYWVAYTGVLDKSSASARQTSARSAGFGDAYMRFVSSD